MLVRPFGPFRGVLTRKVRGRVDGARGVEGGYLWSGEPPQG